jgi:hypothetical protein
MPLLERVGHVPLPPYIRAPDDDADRERYQTVFARGDRGGRGADRRSALRRPLLEGAVPRGRGALPSSPCMSAPAPSSRCASTTSRASHAREWLEVARTACAPSRRPGRAGRPSGRGRHHRGAQPGGRRRPPARSRPAAARPTSSSPRVPVPGVDADDHQLPPAGVHPADAGQRLRRSRLVLDAYRHAVADALPVFQLWRRHVGPPTSGGAVHEILLRIRHRRRGTARPPVAFPAAMSRHRPSCRSGPTARSRR